MLTYSNQLLQPCFNFAFKFDFYKWRKVVIMAFYYRLIMDDIDDILGICCRSFVFRDTVDSLSNSNKILFEFHREIRLVGKVLCIYK